MPEYIERKPSSSPKKSVTTLWSTYVVVEHSSHLGIVRDHLGQSELQDWRT